MANKKTVVTGATGHLGYALVQELLSRGEIPRLLLRRQSELFEGTGVEYAFGDITNYDSLVKAFEGADIVYHLAGIIDIEGGMDDKVAEINVNGTKNVVKACQQCGVRRLVFMGSVDTYPALPGSLEMEEIWYYDPHILEGTYAKTKAIATQYVLNNTGVDGLETIVLQPSACLGPYDFKISSVGVLVRMYMGKRMPVTMNFGGYNFVDVRDIAIAAANAATMGRSGECYILSGEKHTVDEFMKLMAKAAQRKPLKLQLSKSFCSWVAPLTEFYYEAAGKPALLTPYSVRKICENCNFSHRKATEELDFNPRPLLDSIKDMMDWIYENEGPQGLLGVKDKMLHRALKLRYQSVEPFDRSLLEGYDPNKESDN